MDQPATPVLNARHSAVAPLLLGLMLVFAQLLLGVHGAEHLDADHAESCDICLVGSKLSQAHAGGGVPPMPAIGARFAPPSSASRFTARSAPIPCQRGPPRHLQTV